MSQEGRVITWGSKISAAKKGHSVSTETRAKISKTLQGNKNAEGHIVSEEARVKMSGDRKKVVGYLGLHARIKRKLGKPDTCTYCGKSGLSGAQIHWANISREYREDLDDWIRLCHSCHKIYDKNNLSLTKIGDKYVMA